MRYFDKIGIILLLLITLSTAFTNASDGNQTIASQGNTNSNGMTATLNGTITDNDDIDDDDDDGTVYVCGGQNPDNKCTCQNETLNCNRGFDNYWNGETFSHLKIKIRDEGFTAKIVDFRYNKLTKIAKNEILPGHESSVEALLLYYNDVKEIEDGAFDKFTSLKKLGFEVNYLKSMNATILTKQLGSTLEELDFISNNLQNLSTDVFQNLKKLTSLNLSNNFNINLVSKINGINVTIFPEALSNLKTLNLEHCHIRYFDENVFINLRSLENLNIANNRFTTFPIFIKSLSNLRYLNMKYSSIKTISDCDFCGLSNLRAVNLAYTYSLISINENAFGALNNNGSQIPQIEEFSIQGCRVSVLPEKLLNWKNVSKVNLQYNQFTCNCSMAWLINDYNLTSPKIVNNLKDDENEPNKNKLQCYSPSPLRNTHFHSLAGDFCINKTKSKNNEIYYVCDGKNVEKEENTEVYQGCSCDDKSLSCGSPFLFGEEKLNHTNIKVLKRNFRIELARFWQNNITSLKKGKLLPGNENTTKELRFEENKISYIENGTFDKFTSLSFLNFNDNPLTNIDSVVFPASLTSLWLDFTNLSHIPINEFKNLTLLSIGGNPKIFSSNVKPVFPKTLSNLQILGLYSCDISTLNDDIFANLPLLETLYIGQNPFSTIPKPIYGLSNLQHIILDFLNITVLKNDTFESLPMLKSISARFSNIQQIEDCAFCKFPNLTRIDLSNSYRLTWIHENAFGSLTNDPSSKMPKIKEFGIRLCNVSTIHEKLLDWKNVSTIDLESNAITCNCSMAWLINDFNASSPLYVNNLKNIFDNKSNKEDLYCKNPSELRYEPLYKLSGDFCLNETVEPEKENINQVCGESDEENFGCKCDNQNLQCSSLENTNIEIINKTLEIKGIQILFGNISILNLKNLVPEKQKSIESLNFYQCNISSIENGTLNNFTALKTLDLSGNYLTNIDEIILTEQIGSTLIELDLNNNALTLLSSKTFMYLKNLKVLKLSDNTGITVSSELFSNSLSSLERLYLSGCNISNLKDDVFVNLSNLRTLSLSNNPFKTIPTAINSLSNLKNLFVINTEITVLSKKNLKVNKNLQNFYAFYSNIQRIEECAFCNFPNLKEVDLDNNPELYFIHENAFGLAHSFRTSALETFLISGCNLTTLPENLLNWASLKRFTASKNPFTCDCSIKWLIDLIKSKSSIHPQYQCHGPSELNEIPFHQLSDSFCNSTSLTTTNPPTSTTPSNNTVTEGSKIDSSNVQWNLIIFISIFTFILLFVVIAGILYYRKRKIIHIQQNGDGDEDLLQEDFDV